MPACANSIDRLAYYPEDPKILFSLAMEPCGDYEISVLGHHESRCYLQYERCISKVDYLVPILVLTNNITSRKSEKKKKINDYEKHTTQDFSVVD